MMDYDIRRGRTYMYLREEPQFVFGHGLSYTTFALSSLRASSRSLRGRGEVILHVDVRNAGSRDGDEVVQLYVRHPGSRVERAPKALKGFQRVTVPAGETRTVEIPLRGADLAYWDVVRRRWMVERGRVEVLVGASSADRDLALRQVLDVRP
jgi:beta-glucosidase